MEPEIFKIGLSVEAISLYLILDDLESMNVPLEPDNYVHRWNASPDLLECAMEELLIHCVLIREEGRIQMRQVCEWKAVTGV